MLSHRTRLKLVSFTFTRLPGDITIITITIITIIITAIAMNSKAVARN